MSYVLGIDLGTSSLKGALFNREGHLVGLETANYDFQTPKVNFSEQNPVCWIEACLSVITELVKRFPEIKTELSGISFSGQMHSLVLLDKSLNVLRPSILWNDTRTTKECDSIRGLLGDELIKVTKNKVLEGFTLPKLLWVKENEPEIWNDVFKILLPKDYLRWYLTGDISMEYSDASGTLLLDMEARQWSKNICQKLGIPETILPKLVQSTDKVGQLSEEIMERFEFEKEILVFAGGADNACAALGAGIIDDSKSLCSIGTSGVFLSSENGIHDKYKGQLHLFNHVLPNSFYSMGVTLSAGNSLSWIKNIFGDESFDQLLKGIEDIACGSDGLLFTPYIAGERTPYTDSKIRGSFIGLSQAHTKSHLIRAVLEGITMSLNDSKELTESYCDSAPTKIVSVGGGAKNKAWLQMQADIFNSEIITLENEQGPTVGAAMIAAIGLGWFTDVAAVISAFVKYDQVIKPDVENVKSYKLLSDIYGTIYDSTKKISHQLTEYNLMIERKGRI